MTTTKPAAKKPARKPATPAAARDALLAEIAKLKLHIETLETRRSDSLDFHEVSVWGVKDALLAAYEAGYLARAAGR